MELQKKLEILADAAKYDASCASSGATGSGLLARRRGAELVAGAPAFRCASARASFSSSRRRFSRASAASSSRSAASSAFSFARFSRAALKERREFFYIRKINAARLKLIF